MELNNETEQAYKDVAVRLTEIGLKIPTGVYIMTDIVGICNSIALGDTSKDIVTAFQIPCNPASFTGIFKQTTGVSVTDIGKMTAYDKRAIRLKQRAYSEEQVKDILGIIDGN